MATKRKKYHNPYKKYCCVFSCMNKTNKELELTFYTVPKDIERRIMTTKKHSSPYKKYCCVNGCLNKTNKELELTFYNVPKDIERRREWLKAIDREDLLDEKNKVKYNYVCSMHFDDSDFITTICKRLINDAVPTKILPLKSTEDLSQKSKAHSSRLSNKNNVLVPTYSHSYCQTETQSQNEYPYEISIEPQVSKPNIVFMNIEPETAKPNANIDKSSKIPSTNTLQQTTVVYHKDIKTKQSKEASTSTQTDLNESSIKLGQTPSSSNKTSLKRKIKKDVEFVESKRQCSEDVFKVQEELHFDDEVSRGIVKLIDWQNKIKNKFKGNRYAEFKTFALNLYLASPQAYHYLKTILKLPSKNTLTRFRLKIPAKLDDRVLDSLSLKMKSLPSNAKYCTICVDEMALKPNLYYDIKKDELIGFHNINGTISPEISSNAYVIMLQGIYCNWKQPVAYAFLGNTIHYAALDSWINKLILKLFDVGLEIKAIVSNQSSYFDKYAKVIKNVTVDKPYFFVNEHKIFYIFDVPNLMKCMRNDFMSNDIYFKEDKISWEFMTSLYEYQKDKNFLLIPHITEAHVKPNNCQKMSVKYAAQIFSNTVYAALETYIDFGKISAEARGTAKFIKIMNDLFDVLNSSKIKSVQKYQSAFKMSADQKSILLDAQHMFATIQSKNCKTGKDNINKIKTFQNFQITIQSVIQLFEDLNSQGFEYVLTRRLNQDILECFFESIRQQYGSCSKPTPIQFIRAFSKLFHDYLLKTDQTKCESDIYEILLKAEDIMDKITVNPTDLVKPSLVFLSGEIDYHIDLPDTNALTYVASFLLFKCSQKHSNCKEMNKALDSSINVDQTDFTHYKDCNKNKSFYGNLKMPSQGIIEYVQKLDIAFTRNFEHHLRENPGSEIFKLLQKLLLPTLPCLCFPVDYLLRLFVRLRIFTILKFNNLNLKLGKKVIKHCLTVRPL